MVQKKCFNQLINHCKFILIVIKSNYKNQKRGIEMATITDIFHQFASAAIGELFEKGYLLDNLDWDVKAQKYTLRIRGAERQPMVAVGLITFSSKNNKIIVIDAVTQTKSDFEIVILNGKNNIEDFLKFICNWAQELRTISAYK